MHQPCISAGDCLVLPLLHEDMSQYLRAANTDGGPYHAQTEALYLKGDAQQPLWPGTLVHTLNGNPDQGEVLLPQHCRESCGHAAQGVCSDAGSFDLTGANLGAAIQEVLAAVEVALVRRDSEGQTDAQVSAAPQ